MADHSVRGLGGLSRLQTVAVAAIARAPPSRHDRALAAHPDDIRSQATAAAPHAVRQNPPAPPPPAPSLQAASEYRSRESGRLRPRSPRLDRRPAPRPLPSQL